MSEKTEGVYEAGASSTAVMEGQVRYTDVKELEQGAVTSESVSTRSYSGPMGTLRRWSDWFESLSGVEKFGIERIPSSHRHSMTAMSRISIFLVWFSANLTLNNVAIGALGPTVYSLGFNDAIICTIFGNILGCLPVGYIAMFGPRSGCRTLIHNRYTMGFWPSKICVAFNICIMLGYGVIDSVLGGQLIHAISNGNTSVISGIIIISIIAWLVSTTGMKLFHYVERVMGIIQLAIMLVLIGVSGTYWNVDSKTELSYVDRMAMRLSFFCLIASVPVAWFPAGADFFVYYPENTNKWHTLGLAFGGIFTANVLVNVIGVGLGSGTLSNEAWGTAYGNDGISGLMVEVFSPLNQFGAFCNVILMLGLLANDIPGIYSASLSLQMIVPKFDRIPRWMWSTIGTVIAMVIALAGRNYLYNIFEDFLPLMGYWTLIVFVMTLEEQVLFLHDKYDWTIWNSPSKLPVGIAASLAFIIGWIGAIIGMWQTDYVGVVARRIGSEGCEIGIVLCMAMAGVAYPPLRYLEKRYFKR